LIHISQGGFTTVRRAGHDKTKKEKKTLVKDWANLKKTIIRGVLVKENNLE